MMYQIMKINGFNVINKVHRFYPMLIDVGMAFALSRLIFYVVAAIAMLVIPEYSGNDYRIWHTSAPGLIDASWRWDAGWYHAIAREGYSWSHGRESSVGFFPLYPLLLRGVSILISDHQIYVVGVIVNHILFFFALIMVWLYAHKYRGRPVAQRTVYFLSIFPASFFFSAAYSESLYLLLITTVLVLLQRSRFGLAAVFGFLASLTRPTGLWLIVPYIVTAWRASIILQPSWIRRWVPILLIPAGTLLFMAYLAHQFGDPILYIKAKASWGQALSFAPVFLLKAVQLVFKNQANGVSYIMNVTNTCAAIWALAMIVWLWRRNSAGAAFALASILTPLTFAVQDMPTTSIARFVVVLCPLFLPLAEWANTWWRQMVIIALFLPVNVFLTALFVQWYHVV